MAPPTSYSDDQLRVLEKIYKRNQHPPKAFIDELSQTMGIDKKKIDTWFTKRRAKKKESKVQLGQSVNTYPASPTPQQIRRNLREYVRDHEISECTDVNLRGNSYDGVDNNLKDIIDTNEELNKYFEGTIPDLLSGTQYDTIGYIAKGQYGRVILAQNTTTKEYVVVKIPCEIRDNLAYVKDLLKEFMHQERAHNALKGMACSAPRALGLMRMKSNTVTRGYIYMLVFEFIPVLPNTLCTMTLKQAIKEHKEGRSVIGEKKEWRTLIQDLIQGTDVLQQNDIAHNDLKRDNVLIQFGLDEQPKPVFIDYGLSTTLTSANTYLPFEVTEGRDIYSYHVGPELFSKSHPLPTSDLYSVARMTQILGYHIGEPELQTLGAQYCDTPYRQRQDHRAFCRSLMGM